MPIRKRPHRSTGNSTNYSRLERRQLLAGDVRVFIDGDVLLVVGDSADNEVQIARDNAGLSVTGLDTTINGLSTPLEITGSFRHFTIGGNAGNDTVTVSDFTNLRGNFSVLGGDGDDRIDLRNVFARHIHLETGSGNDVIETAATASGKSAYFYLGEGDDTVAIDSMQAGRNLKFFGGGGNDTVVSNELNANRRLVLELEDGNDQALLTGATSSGFRTRFEFGAGNDSILIEPETNGATASLRNPEIQLGDGDDTVATDASVRTRRGGFVDGNVGNDTGVFANTLDVDISNIENNTGTDLQEIRDGIFALLVSLNIDVSPFDGTAGQNTLTISTTSDALLFEEGGDEVEIDPELTLSATGITEVSGATIQMAAFDSEQDIIAFEDTGNITGSFDSATGELALIGIDTVDAYQMALRNVTYRNTSAAPTTDDRAVTFSIEAAGQTSTATRTIQVNAIDSPAVISLDRNEATVQATLLPFAIDPALTLSDPDSAQISSVTVSITSGFEASEDELSVSPQNGIEGTYVQATGVLTISNPGGNSSLADMQSVLRTLSYDNGAGTPTAGTRGIQFSIAGETTAQFDLDLESES